MTLQLYQTLFIIFVSLTIVFAILSVVLYFLFDIRKIIRVKTGADLRQSMRKLYDVNRGSSQRKRYRAGSVPPFKDTDCGMPGPTRPAGTWMIGTGMTGTGKTEPACSKEEQVTELFRSDGDRNATTVLTIPF